MRFVDELIRIREVVLKLRYVVQATTKEDSASLVIKYFCGGQLHIYTHDKGGPACISFSRYNLQFYHWWFSDAAVPIIIAEKTNIIEATRLLKTVGENKIVYAFAEAMRQAKAGTYHLNCGAEILLYA